MAIKSVGELLGREWKGGENGRGRRRRTEMVIIGIVVATGIVRVLKYVVQYILNENWVEIRWERFDKRGGTGDWVEVLCWQLINWVRN